MKKKLLTTIALAFSFFVVTLSGYNCSQRVYERVEQEIPVNQNTSTQTSGSKQGSVPSTPTKKCNRKQYSDLEEKYGEYTFIHLEEDNFSDYLFGHVSNFDPGCPRIFVDMNQTKQDTFKGSLRIAYEGSSSSGKRVLKLQKYSSGRSEEANKYNKWTEDDLSDRSQEFFAFFEDGSSTSLILHVEDVDTVPVQDGEDEYFGQGTIWFKMFRTLARRGDNCYTGVYIKDAHTKPSRPDSNKDSCWLLGIGPYSCLPDGIRTSITEDNMEDPTCYKKLGEFGNLDLIRAFNIEDPNDLK